MVETAIWNDENDMLAGVTDGKFVVWYYPNVVFVDEDITAMTRLDKDGRYFLYFKSLKTQVFLEKTHSWSTLCRLNASCDVPMVHWSPSAISLLFQLCYKSFQERISGKKLSDFVGILMYALFPDAYPE